MLEELCRQILVDDIFPGEFQRQGEQVQAVHCHPARSVDLLEASTRRQSVSPVEGPDVVEPQKTSLKKVVALRVLSVHPPGEVKHQLLKYPLQEHAVLAA